MTFHLVFCCMDIESPVTERAVLEKEAYKRADTEEMFEIMKRLKH